MLLRDKEEDPETDLQFLPRGTLADYRLAGMQDVLSRCKLHTGGCRCRWGR